MKLLHEVSTTFHKMAVIGGEVFAFLISPALMKIAAALLIFMGLFVRGREVYLTIKNWKKQ